MWIARSAKHPKRFVECLNRWEGLGAATGLLDGDETDTIEIVSPDGQVQETVRRTA